MAYIRNMNQSTTLNKLKLLNLRNSWQVSIVQELSNRRGASARVEPLFLAVRKRLKAVKEPDAKKNFNNAVAKLSLYGLLFEKVTAAGSRLHLLRSVWQLDDAILESVSIATIALSKGRRARIQWTTILKEVRSELSSHNIQLPMKITRTLVHYFLLRRCGWQHCSDGDIRPPKKIHNRSEESPEQQQDLFA